MKKTPFITNTRILFLTLIVSYTSYSQTINSYYGTAGAVYNDNRFENRSIMLDESATGANAVWDFSNINPKLVQYPRVHDGPQGQITDTYARLSGAAMGNATTRLISQKNYSGNSMMKTYTRDVGASVYFTARSGKKFEIYFTGDDGAVYLGDFPLSFDDDEITTKVSGKIRALRFKGTFKGTTRVKVDAWGTLTYPSLSGVKIVDEPVTRLTIKTDIYARFGGLAGKGPATQIIRHYYSNKTGELLFRTGYLTYNLRSWIIKSKGEEKSMQVLFSSPVNK